MSFFSRFSGFLEGPVGNGQLNKPADLQNTKKHLRDLNYLANDEPDGDFITKALDKGIKAFQKDNELVVDGKLLPRGETEQAIFQQLEGSAPNLFLQEMDTENQSIGYGQNISGTLGKPMSEETENTPLQNFEISQLNEPIASEEAVKKPNSKSGFIAPKVPEGKQDIFKNKREAEWHDFTKATHDDANIPPSMKDVLNNIFAYEGGLAKADGSSAYAGIIKGTLNDTLEHVIKSEDPNLHYEEAARIRAKYGDDITPSDLDAEDILPIYKIVIGRGMAAAVKGQKKPATQLLDELGDKQVTMVITDMLFRHGAKLTTEHIQTALKHLDPSYNVDTNHVFGSQVYHTIKNTIQDTDKKNQFLENINNSRKSSRDKHNVAEEKRFDFMNVVQD